MSIDNSTVKKVASLARIEIKGDEEDTIINELNNIIGWVDELQKINTDNVEPLLSVFNESMSKFWRFFGCKQIILLKKLRKI